MWAGNDVVILQLLPNWCGDRVFFEKGNFMFIFGGIHFNLIYNKTGKDTRNNAKEYTYLDMSISLSVAENCRRLSCRI